MLEATRWDLEFGLRLIICHVESIFTTRKLFPSLTSLPRLGRQKPEYLVATSIDSAAQRLTREFYFKTQEFCGDAEQPQGLT